MCSENWFRESILPMKTGRIIPTILAWLLLALFIFPIYWLITSSIKTPEDIFAKPPKLFMFTLDFHSYYHVLARTHIGDFILNSIIIFSISVLIAMIAGTLAAYGLNRFTFKGKKDISFWIISVRMAPPIVAIVPIFILVRLLGLYDKHAALVIIYLMFNIPFTVWMMRGYISQIPVEMDEAALIEGCNRFQVLRYIILPLVKTGMLTTAIMNFIFSWNEFFFAFLLTGSEAKTVPVGISGYITQTGIRWDELTTAGTIILVPILTLSLIVGRHFIRGLLEGALKD